MGIPSDQSSQMLAPIGGGSAPVATQRLAGTGTTESNNATALTPLALATLYNGAGSIRVSFRGSTGIAGAVATTDLLIAAYARFDWYVTPDTDIVYVEAGDAASAYECWVWSSSP